MTISYCSPLNIHISVNFTIKALINKNYNRKNQAPVRVLFSLFLLNIFLSDNCLLIFIRYLRTFTALHFSDLFKKERFCPFCTHKQEVVLLLSFRKTYLPHPITCPPFFVLPRFCNYEKNYPLHKNVVRPCFRLHADRCL